MARKKKPRRISDFEVQYLYWIARTNVGSGHGLALIRDAIRENPAMLDRAWGLARESKPHNLPGYFIRVLENLWEEQRKAKLIR